MEQHVESPGFDRWAIDAARGLREGGVCVPD